MINDLYMTALAEVFPFHEPEPAALAEPDDNSYVITLHLTDVRKRDALRFAECIRALAAHEIPLSSVAVTVAHVKGVALDG